MAQFIPGIYNKIIIKILGYFWGVTKLIPMKHVSTVQKDKAILTYAIVSRFMFNVGMVIENSIIESVYGKAITHPSLITELCLLAGVEISRDEEKCPPMVPFPFPKKNKAVPQSPCTIKTPT